MRFQDNDIVSARHRIADSPLAASDCSVPKDAEGIVVDTADGYVFVEFASGVLLCLPEELRHAPLKRREQQP